MPDTTLHEFYTSCPVVRQTEETFVEYVTVGGQRQRMAFTKQVLWLQESEAAVQFVHGGEVVDDIATTNDHYGYLSSIRVDLDDGTLARLARKYSIEQNSSLELRVTATVFMQPVVETEEGRKHNRERGPRMKARYACVPDAWRKELLKDGQTVWPTLARVVLGTGIVWSSQNTPEKNESLAAAFRAQWAVKKAPG